MMLVSLTTVTHSADFSSLPTTEDRDPQLTPKPGKRCWPFSWLCVVICCDYTTQLSHHLHQ